MPLGRPVLGHCECMYCKQQPAQWDRHIRLSEESVYKPVNNQCISEFNGGEIYVYLQYVFHSVHYYVYICVRNV